MAMTMKVQNSATIGGVNFAEARTVSAESAIVNVVNVPAAQAGSLTTRSSDTAGQITVADSGHTITTGARLDLYWTVAGVPGMRRGVVAGTVSGSVVPISGGSGDVLPASSTTINVALPVQVGFNILGDDVVGIAAYSPVRGQVVLVEDSDVEALAILLAEKEAYIYNSDSAKVSPVDDAALVAAYLSHGDVVAARDVQLGILFNNA